ncbi:hypothetical protein FEM01_16460 [Pseudomonas mosselii]|uniref:Uncharacterized protein n=1 Tax=Pseudomonas mosselii TaxID=78327 RepID=A0A5R8YXN1_9PSED|nr:hypothetical protein FEM01_16460 [Pseudomonas mosselii]
MQGLGVAAQHLGRQQQGRAVDIAVEGGSWLAGHQCRSLAALNALALRTGVIVILTIPEPHKIVGVAGVVATDDCWSGGPVYIP